MLIVHPVDWGGGGGLTIKRHALKCDRQTHKYKFLISIFILCVNHVREILLSKNESYSNVIIQQWEKNLAKFKSYNKTLLLPKIFSCGGRNNNDVNSHCFCSIWKSWLLSSSLSLSHWHTKASSWLVAVHRATQRTSRLYRPINVSVKINLQLMWWTNGLFTLDDTENDTETETDNDNYGFHCNMHSTSHCTETISVMSLA